MLTSLGVGLLVTPLVVHELGTRDYGLWVLVLALVGYFPVFDLGFRRALIHDTAVRRSRGETSEIREGVSTFFLLFCVLGCLIMLATLALAVALPHLFNVSGDQVGSARFMLVVVGATWALQFPSNAPVAVLLGYDRYDGVNALDTLSRLAEGIGTAIALSQGAGVQTLAIIMASVELPKGVARFVLAYRLVPEFRISLRSVNLDYLKRATRRSASYFISTANSMVNTRTDEVLIGAFLTVSSVGIYGVALRMINLGRSFAIQLNDVLVPTAARLVNARGGRRELAAMTFKATRVTGAVAGAIALASIAFGRPFLELWIGPEVRGAYWPLVILSVMSYIALVQSIHGTVLLASDRHKFVAKLTMLTMAANIGLSILLLHWLGISGVALGTLIPYTITGTITVIMGSRIARSSPIAFVVRAILPSLMPAVLAGLAGWGLQELRPADSWLVLVAELSAVMLVYSVPVVLLSFPIRRSWLLLLNTAERTFHPSREDARLDSIQRRTARPLTQSEVKHDA